MIWKLSACFTWSINPNRAAKKRKLTRRNIAYKYLEFKMTVKKYKFIMMMNTLVMSTKLLKVKLLKLHITSTMLTTMKMIHTKVMNGANNLNQLVVQQMWLGKKKDKIEKHKKQEKWENIYPFNFFLCIKKGWLCHACSDYRADNDFWQSKTFKLLEHLARIFSCHENSQKHKDTLEKQTEFRIPISEFLFRQPQLINRFK